MRPEIDIDIVKSLVQVGLLAAWERMFPEAETILNGLNGYELDLPHIGYTYALMYHARGESATAIDLLRNDVLRKHPQDHMAKSLLGFLLQQTGQNGWRELCEEVLKQGGDSAAADLAKNVLQSADAPPAKALGNSEAALTMVRA